MTSTYPSRRDAGLGLRGPRPGIGTRGAGGGGRAAAVAGCPRSINVKIGGKDKGEAERETPPVDLHSLLP